jgi:hypothetical protein
LSVTLLLSIASQITERETGFFRSPTMVLIYDKVRRFRTQICFHLQVKCEEAPNLFDPLKLLFVTGPSLRVHQIRYFLARHPKTKQSWLKKHRTLLKIRTSDKANEKKMFSLARVPSFDP